MSGCRPLSREELARVLAMPARGFYRVRVRTLFVLGKNTGFRVLELLSLNMGDVFQDGVVVDRVTVARRNMKGGKNKEKKAVQSRTVFLNAAAKEALAAWFPVVQGMGMVLPADPLFCAAGGKRWDRVASYVALVAMLRRAGCRGKLGTHCMRKTFAKEVYGAFRDQVAAGKPVDPLRMTAKAMGHASIDNTDKYLAVQEDAVDAVIAALGV